MHIYTFSGKNNFLSVTRVFLPIGAGKTVNAFYIEYWFKYIFIDDHQTVNSPPLLNSKREEINDIEF